MPMSAMVKWRFAARPRPAQAAYHSNERLKPFHSIVESGSHLQHKPLTVNLPHRNRPATPSGTRTGQNENCCGDSSFGRPHDTAKGHYRKSRSHARFAHLCVDAVRGQSGVRRWASLRSRRNVEWVGAGRPLTPWLRVWTISPAAGSNSAVNFDDRQFHAGHLPGYLYY
jgi:hypothetical protein